MQFLAKNFVLFSFLVFTFAGCFTPQKQQTDEEKLQKEDELVFSDEHSDSGEVVKSEQFKGGTSLQHPKRPDEQTTRALIYSVPQPRPEEIALCRQDINNITEDATSQEQMKKAIKKVVSFGKNRVAIYHWCFYQSMAALDIRLNENRTNLETQANIFVRNMRALWIMSKAMQRLTKNKKYFTYLQIRYKQISQNNFGRSLEETDKLLSSSDSKSYREANKKSAGAYQE